MLERQPANPNVISEITAALMAPVSSYRHARPHIPTVEPLYTDIAKRRPRSTSIHPSQRK